MTGRIRRWWSGRTLRVRITLVVGLVALAALLALSRFGAGLLYTTLVRSADAELRADAQRVAAAVVAGTAPEAARGPGVRVVDTAGTPLDGGPALDLDRRGVRRLAAGEPFTSGHGEQSRRWLAVPAVTADGTTTLVVASADLVGGTGLLRRATAGLLVAALLVAAVVATAAWAATRAALRPVDRLRAAAAALPAGERLPVPGPPDELRALAEELNALLARRDEAAARLERFTGDAAHELRSPVAAIRAQAEVAVAHPDPASAGATLQAIAAEAERLSALLADLLALARADAGQRAPARPVDLVAAARAAVDRAADRAGAAAGPAVRLVAPGPATVAASPGEVALVLDNLIGNARRHAASLVRVGVLPAGRWVRLVVEDDGPGIPEADRRRVFDRFTRLDPPTGPDRASGAGLGLALVAALVEGRGGTVAAGEAPGGGARLDVRWPAALAPPSRVPGQRESDIR